MEQNLEELIDIIKDKFSYYLNDNIFENYQIDWRELKKSLAQPISIKLSNHMYVGVLTFEEVLDLIKEELHYDEKLVYYSEIDYVAFERLDSNLINDFAERTKRSMLHKYIESLPEDTIYKFKFEKEYIKENELESLFFYRRIYDLEKLKSAKPFRIKMTIWIKNNKEV